MIPEPVWTSCFEIVFGYVSDRPIYFRSILNKRPRSRFRMLKTQNQQRGKCAITIKTSSSTVLNIVIASNRIRVHLHYLKSKPIASSIGTTTQTQEPDIRPIGKDRPTAHLCGARTSQHPQKYLIEINQPYAYAQGRGKHVDSFNYNSTTLVG